MIFYFLPEHKLHILHDKLLYSTAAFYGSSR